MIKSNISCPCWESNPDTSNVQPAPCSVYLLSYPASQFYLHTCCNIFPLNKPKIVQAIFKVIIKHFDKTSLLHRPTETLILSKINSNSWYVFESSSVWQLSPISRIKQYNFFLILDCEAIGTAATPGLLCQLWVKMKMIVEKQMECRLAGETEVLGRNLPQRHFCPS
jgi:hypothetical protein